MVVSLYRYVCLPENVVMLCVCAFPFAIAKALLKVVKLASCALPMYVAILFYIRLNC